MISCLAAFVFLAPTTLIRGGTVIDGSGKPGFLADVRIEGEKIVEVGHLTAQPGEMVWEAKGLVVSPGFIDAHSHAAGRLEALESQMRQGITTAIGGQDGGRDVPVRKQMEETKNARIRFEYFSGHGGLREEAMKSLSRKAAPFEIRKMEALLDQDMKDGALGLSSGLEYDAGTYSSTQELIDLARVASRHGGIYISHVRDESSGIFDSVHELIRIAREGKLPAQISHVKMAVASVWGQSGKVIRMVEDAQKEGLDVTADVYPYTYWQSTIRVLTTSRDQKNPAVWKAALDDVGGTANVRLTTYSPNAAWVGKTLEQISKETGKDGPTLILDIIAATEGGKGRESVLVTAMTEGDLVNFIKTPWIMFCSDGSGGGSHPRGPGSFPRILGRYVREQKVISLEEAIRKMTSLPAWRFKLKDRGYVKPGYSADLVVFDPKTIRDTATPDNPTSMAVGVQEVYVKGKRTAFR